MRGPARLGEHRRAWLRRQDCRGRHGSKGQDRVYANDAADGYDTPPAMGSGRAELVTTSQIGSTGRVRLLRLQGHWLGA